MFLGLINHDFFQIAYSLATGSAKSMANISKKMLNLNYLAPDRAQEQFAAFVAQVDKSKVEIQKAIDQLEILKKSLMQQYFG